MKTSANLQKAGSGGGRGWNRITISKKGDKVKSCCHKDGNICKRQDQSKSGSLYTIRNVSPKQICFKKCSKVDPKMR